MHKANELKAAADKKATLERLKLSFLDGTEDLWAGSARSEGSGSEWRGVHFDPARRIRAENAERAMHR